jgi:hypothetical protein
MLLALAVVIVGVTGFFRLSRDAQCLRDSLAKSLVFQSGSWNKKIQLRVGAFTCEAVRLGLSFIHLQPEARTALRAVRGGEVGVYQLGRGSRFANYSAMIEAADEAMARRGWDRLVGVAQEHELVVVYVPRSVSPSNVRACVAVLNEQLLVVASARSDLEPLMELALSRPEWKNREWLPGKL